MAVIDRPIVVLGAGGQLGRALAELLGDQAVALDRAGADLSRPASLADVVKRHSPSAVINAAAYTLVDRAESEPELAMLVNGEAPGALARLCADEGIPFVHFSTDYVFDGTGESPWRADDPTGPVNVYGATKLAGEQAVRAAGGRHLIFRTSWVYDATGRNFLTTMLRLMRERPALSVVADQHGAPTYARHLAIGALHALETATGADRFPGGVYHLCNGGETTWYGFACAIRDEALARGMSLAVERIDPIATSDYPTPAARPHNSRLDTNTTRDVLGVSLPHWQEGLAECMQEYEHHRSPH